MTRRRTVLRALPGVGLAALGGCSVLGSGDAPRFDFYVIEDLRSVPAPAAAAPPRIERTLLLTAGPSQALYDSDRIAYTRDRTSRSYYQYSNWSERPARRILALAEARLAAGGAFRSVAQTLAGVRGDLVLSLRLEELLHDDSEPPGAVRVAVTGELVDWRSRVLVSRRSFAQSAPAASRDAPGAARAASVAVTAMLDALSGWVEAGAASAA